MRGINKVILLGNVGKAPERRDTADGRPITSFSLATRRVFLDKAGQKQEETEWHRLISFGRIAEICSDYLEKGRPVYVEGRLQTRQFSDKQGVNRYITEVLVDTLQLLGRPEDGRDRARPAAPIVRDETADLPF